MTNNQSNQRVQAVVRLWLADRPGMLGTIATSLGQLGVDVVGIEILERTSALAVDELALEFDADVIQLDKIVAGLKAIDGVGVEDARVRQSVADEQRSLLSAAVLLTRFDGLSYIAYALNTIAAAVDASWVALVRNGSVVDRVGECPTDAWIVSYALGRALTHNDDDDDQVSEDVLAIGVQTDGDVLLVGRPGRPLRFRERRELRSIAEISTFVERAITG
jgi:hypothetical protein